MLRVQGVSKSFMGQGNGIKALDCVSLYVEEGEFVVIIGSNGSGKTTLLNTIAGSHLPDSGTIYLAGHPLNDIAEHRRAKWLGRVFQRPDIGTAPYLTVEENMAIASFKTRNPRLVKGVTTRMRSFFEEQVKALEMGLENRLSVPMHVLSGGQRQALSVLMATLSTPKLLLLDEHTSSLDPRASERVLRITEEMVRRSKLTTLMVTHNVTQALALGDRLVMMDSGRLIGEVCGDEKRGLSIDEVVRMYSTRSDSGVSGRLLT